MKTNSMVSFIIYIICSVDRDSNALTISLAEGVRPLLHIPKKMS